MESVTSQVRRLNWSHSRAYHLRISMALVTTWESLWVRLIWPVQDAVVLQADSPPE